MSHVNDLVAAFAADVGVPWRRGLSGGERVWMLVYPPSDERSVRHRLPELEQAAKAVSHGWLEVDLTDELGRWVAADESSEEFFSDPGTFTSAIVEELEQHLADTINSRLQSASDEDVIALVGLSSLFPFLRVSSVMSAVEGHVRGRLLVLFPGRHDAARHSYRLLDAHDGFTYRARLIALNKEDA